MNRAKRNKDEVANQAKQTLLNQIFEALQHGLHDLDNENEEDQINDIMPLIQRWVRENDSKTIS